MKKFKFVIRTIGLLICLREYYAVLTVHQLVMFHSVLVSDWTIYILPLTAPFIAEWCIIATSAAKRRIEEQNKPNHPPNRGTRQT